MIYITPRFSLLTVWETSNRIGSRMPRRSLPSLHRGEVVQVHKRPHRIWNGLYFRLVGGGLVCLEKDGVRHVEILDNYQASLATLPAPLRDVAEQVDAAVEALVS